MSKGLILILGGAGYIGSHVNYWLTHNGFDTVIFDNLSYGHREFVKWGTFIEGDLADEKKVWQLFSEFKFDAVIHLAAFAHVGESVIEPAKYYGNNVANTIKLLQAMRHFQVNKMIFSSTCAVYGEPKTKLIEETHPRNPINPYGKSKLMIEKILEDFSYAYDFNHISLRYFNAAGAKPDVGIGEWHHPETHLIPLAIKSIYEKNQFLNIYGADYDTKDGTCIRDYTHVLDIADAHLKATMHLLNNKTSHALNLGLGQGFSVKEIITSVERVTGKKVPYKISKRREGDPPYLVANAKKAQTILKWSPQHFNIDDIIQSAWLWENEKMRALISA
jgi:UDP-glucose 4-epimerase